MRVRVIAVLVCATCLIGIASILCFRALYGPIGNFESIYLATGAAVDRYFSEHNHMPKSFSDLKPQYDRLEWPGKEIPEGCQISISIQYSVGRVRVVARNGAHQAWNSAFLLTDTRALWEVRRKEGALETDDLNLAHALALLIFNELKSGRSPEVLSDLPRSELWEELKKEPQIKDASFTLKSEYIVIHLDKQAYSYSKAGPEVDQRVLMNEG